MAESPRLAFVQSDEATKCWGGCLSSVQSWEVLHALGSNNASVYKFHQQGDSLFLYNYPGYSQCWGSGDQILNYLGWINRKIKTNLCGDPQKY